MSVKENMRLQMYYPNSQLLTEILWKLDYVLAGLKAQQRLINFDSQTQIILRTYHFFHHHKYVVSSL